MPPLCAPRFTCLGFYPAAGKEEGEGDRRGGRRAGAGGNGGKRRLPLCDRDGDRDRGTPCKCHCSAFCCPSVDTHRQRDQKALLFPQGSLGWDVCVSPPAQTPGSTAGLIPQDEEPQAPSWEHFYRGSWFWGAALLRVPKPAFTAGGGGSDGWVGGFWSGSGWTIPRDAADSHAGWASRCLWGDTHPSLGSQGAAAPFSLSPAGLQLLFQRPPAPIWSAQSKPWHAVAPSLLSPPCRRRIASHHIFHPAKEILTGMEFVSLCFLPSVAIMCAKRPGRNLSWLGPDSAFGEIHG